MILQELIPPSWGVLWEHAGTLASQTPENGWMVFDCDYFNTPIHLKDSQDTDGSLTSPIIDFSD